jgi:L-cysteine:1D-myo-inositol 2-amino-2-deoxy-alpha-D-glucopyranoside ligase
MAADLNAPAALAEVDKWAALASASGTVGSQHDQALASDAIDALLGVRL